MEAANTSPLTTIYPVIRLHSKHSVSSGCFDADPRCLLPQWNERKTIWMLGWNWKRKRRPQETASKVVHTLSGVYKWEETLQSNPELLHPAHTWTHLIPTLSQSDTDGANMRNVSGVVRERYLLARWKPNAVNYAVCLPDRFSPRGMTSQDKLVISQKQSIWKHAVQSETPSCTLEWGKWQGHGAVGHVCGCVLDYMRWRCDLMKTPFWKGDREGF